MLKNLRINLIVWLFLGVIAQGCTLGNANSTPTPLPMLTGPTGQEDQPGAKHAFMMSFLLKETAACPSSTPCDTVFVPNIGLYFRGDLAVGPGGKISGGGPIQVIQVDDCQTLQPGVSSCVVDGYENGSFSITGKVVDDRVVMTLTLDRMPAIMVTMSTESGLNRVDLPFQSTYHEEMSQVFDAAGIFNREISGSVLVGAKTPVDTFMGSFTFAKGRTMSGLGSIFFIDVSTPLPEYSQP